MATWRASPKRYLDDRRVGANTRSEPAGRRRATSAPRWRATAPSPHPGGAIRVPQPSARSRQDDEGGDISPRVPTRRAASLAVAADLYKAQDTLPRPLAGCAQPRGRRRHKISAEVVASCRSQPPAPNDNATACAVERARHQGPSPQPERALRAKKLSGRRSAAAKPSTPRTSGAGACRPRAGPNLGRRGRQGLKLTRAQHRLTAPDPGDAPASPATRRRGKRTTRLIPASSSPSPPTARRIKVLPNTSSATPISTASVDPRIAENARAHSVRRVRHDEPQLAARAGASSMDLASPRDRLERNAPELVSEGAASRSQA